jgi:hypothetical protein
MVLFFGGSMFDVKTEQVTGTQNRLLFNIWQELKAIREQIQAGPVRPAREGTEAKPERSVKPKLEKCPKCNKPAGAFKSRQSFAGHISNCKGGD